MAGNLGINAWFGYLMPLKERLTLIKKTGFDGIQLTWEDELEPFNYSRFKFFELSDQLDLKVLSVHSGIFNTNNAIWDRDHKERDNLLIKIKKEVTELNGLGSIPYILHIDETGIEHFNLSDGLQFFEEIVSFATNKNVQIAIENISRPELIEFLLSNFQTSYLKLCYDNGHAHLLGRDAKYLFDHYKDRLSCLHIHTNNGESDEHRIPVGSMNYLNDLKVPKILEVIPTALEQKELTAEEFLIKAYTVITGLLK